MKFCINQTAVEISMIPAPNKKLAGLCLLTLL
jgi:hypothetical protein